MGTSFNPQTVQSGFRDESLINQILADIRSDLENKVDRNGVSPNAMNADMDLGSNRLLNVAQGVIGTDGVNLNQVQNLATQIAQTIFAVSGTALSNSNPLTFNFGVATGSQGTSGRTVFDLESLFGVTSFLGLTVIVNGVVQIPGLAYSITNQTVTFTEALNSDSDILFIYGDLSPTPTVPLSVNNYDIAIFLPGVPDSSEEIMRFVLPRDVLFEDDFAGSQANAGVAATGSTVLNVQVDGVTVGTITFAAAGTTGTFATSAGELTVSAGEVLSIVAPATADATLADISITLKGARLSQ
jgi:hypothetical protein